MSVLRGASPWRVFLLAFVIYAYFMPRWADWNIDSRLDLTHAIVDEHSLQIDTYNWNTWDKAQYRGHFYSDKAPGTALLGALIYAPYAAARTAPLTGAVIAALERNSAWNVAIQLGKTATQASPAPKGTRLGGCQRAGPGNVQWIPWGNRLAPFPSMRDWALSKYVISVGSVALPSALFAAFFFWFLGFFLTGLWIRWALVGLYAFGTVALPYSTVFYSHQLSAAMLFTAFALIYLLARQRIGNWAAPAAGFLLGFALFTEYTVGLIIIVLAAYALWVLRGLPAAIVQMAVAGALPIAGLMLYNYLCFGNALDTGYSHDFCWAAAQAQGFQGFTYPHPGPLFDLTIGSYRGLFYLSPFLLFAVPGAILMARRGWGLEAATCVVIGAMFILAISSYWGWNGGRVEGPRYLVACVPFVAMPVVFFLDVAKRHKVLWALIIAAAAWSFFAVWVELIGGPWFPVSWWRDPIFQYSLPYLSQNSVASNAGFFLGLRGWESLVPLALLILLLFPWRLDRLPARGAAPERARSLSAVGR